MERSARILLLIVGTLICFFIIIFLSNFILGHFEVEARYVFIIALVMAALIGRFLWRILQDATPKYVSLVFITALVVGVIGLLAGYFGPIYFSNNPLGPLLGIFITGPLSFVIGLIGGGIYWKIKLKKDKNILE